MFLPLMCCAFGHPDAVQVEQLASSEVPFVLRAFKPELWGYKVTGEKLNLTST